MTEFRIIPCLLVSGNGLVKTIKFNDARYIGDPVNAVRIFSDKEADEIVVLDIDATKYGRDPNFELISEMAGEAFMPMAYGGGIRTFDQARQLIRCGIEKIVINTAAVESLELIRSIAKTYGRQAVVGAIDVKKTLLGGYRIMTHSGTKDGKVKMDTHIENLLEAGVGELLVNNIDRDGTMLGYDLDLIKKITAKVNVPVVACGGAGGINDMVAVIEQGGASAAAAGSMFVYHGKHRAVLISYPKNLIGN
jgi:cyclase